MTHKIRYDRRISDTSCLLEDIKNEKTVGECLDIFFDDVIGNYMNTTDLHAVEN